MVSRRRVTRLRESEGHNKLGGLASVTDSEQAQPEIDYLLQAMAQPEEFELLFHVLGNKMNVLRTCLFLWDVPTYENKFSARNTLVVPEL